MTNGIGKFLGGVVVGTAIGVVTGILIAPRSGKDTRNLLKKSARQIPLLAEKAWEETLERLQEAIIAGREASQRLHEVKDNISTVETSARSEGQRRSLFE
ncbi:MAG: YtxH domain-containing protein [Pseudanabaenaceae cyanobacterium SKYGB_i_bin29]|nr:YtxH domain-containing protein [Pseudanabaenaceae cyanobacterium SKYG29]MDW8420291.1 YtxH domain-containing protein [Pseudanabaenaceae cyanobacterium SKYGB_i_bin29]